MGRVVRGAEVLRPPGGERLRLIAPREEGQLLGILAQGGQPLGGLVQRLFPGDLLELARPALAGAQQGLHQPGW